MTEFYTDDGYLDQTCCWCGKSAADDEKIEVVQFSSSSADWMHLDCERLYSERCKKQNEEFYAIEVLKFVRGEPCGITPGTVGEARAKIAKDLIAKHPALALPENLHEFIAAVEAVEHDDAVAKGYVIALSDEEMTKFERRVKESNRLPALRRAADVIARRALQLLTPKERTMRHHD